MGSVACCDPGRDAVCGKGPGSLPAWAALTRTVTLEALWGLEPTPPHPNMGRLLQISMLETLCNLPDTVSWETAESEKSCEQIMQDSSGMKSQQL